MINRYVIYYNRRIQQLEKIVAVLAITGMVVSPFLFSRTTQADVETFTVKTYKVVCETEEDLPDWGMKGEEGKPEGITATTAQDYVSQSDGACHMAEVWSFEWGYNGEATKKDGDFVGEAGEAEGWHDFTNEVQIEATSSRVWFREVLPEGYLPFNDAKDTTDPQVSAEFYCDEDILNYDNYDYIEDYEPGDVYHCVAFNVLEEQDPVCGNGEIEEGEECEVGCETCEPSYYTCNLETCQCEPPVCDPVIELIDNGDFEEPLTDPNLWDIFTSAQTGWDVAWVTSVDPAYEETPYLELHGGVNEWDPNTGEQYAELDSDWDGPEGSINNEPASVSISQDIPTIPEYDYEISFAFSPRPDTGAENNKLQFSWNGSVMGTFQATGSANTVWTPHTYHFSATDVTTTIEFKDLGTPNSLGTFLDSVSVTCYPGEEPQPECGNGELEGDEECDWGTENGEVCTPGYNDSCDYCSQDCTWVTLEGGYCGNEAIEGEEECDDGNNEDGDGCSSECTIEQDPGPEPYCGDDYKDPEEECDNGEGNKDDMLPVWDFYQGGGDRTYCSTNCELYHVTGTWCGDGTVNGPETCESDGDCEEGMICAECMCVEQGPGPEPEPECTDNDGDGYSIEGEDCGPVDCDDEDPLVYPGSTEVCDNGIDDDCDGDIDSSDSDCQEDEGGGGGGGGIVFFHLRIFNEENNTPDTDSVLVTWFTNTPATSRVVYDTVPHSTADLGDPPNYGYAFSTEEDSTKVTYHEMIVDGLTPGVTYYWRAVSHGSGEVVGKELAFQTIELPCREEGESIPVIANPPECCEGLDLISPQSADIVGSAGICTALCGNGICDAASESPYNCPADCEVIITPEEETGTGEQEEEEVIPEEGGEVPPVATTSPTTTPEETTPEETSPEDLTQDSTPAVGWLADLQAIVSGLFGGEGSPCVPWWATALLIGIALFKAIQSRGKDMVKSKKLGIWSILLIVLMVLLQCMPIWLFLILIAITFFLCSQKKAKKEVK